LVGILALVETWATINGRLYLLMSDWVYHISRFLVFVHCAVRHRTQKWHGDGSKG
jgi:hypothetical protein